MSPRRSPQAPPDLPGFTFIELLGSGGFADVFLYEQHLPRRRVAVKVLLTERMTSGSITEFTAEANVMALLSTHPAIVTIYQAGLADDGRPYIVMEYCPRPTLQVRYRRETFSVAEVLRIGVQVAAAVETAHRAGVLHRDIKPANILVTEYNRPALTDFGIASTTGAAEAGGLSIPWSPPEAVAATVPSGDARSDVWSLGATVYSLLAGRSPFELAGERNAGQDLIERIESLPVPPLQRPDIPASLQHALERSMAKSPDARYDTALAFGRALQKVQIELAHSVTAIDIIDDGVPDGIVDSEDDGLTRVRGVVSIDPAAPHPTPDDASLWAPPSSTGAASAPVSSGFAPLSSNSASADPSGAPAGEPGALVSGASTAAPIQVPADARRSRRGLWAGIGAGAFGLVVATVLAFALPVVLGGGAAPEPTGSPTDEPIDVIPYPAPPAGLAGTVTADGVVFSWTNADPAEGDEYLWGLVARDGEASPLTRVAETTVTVPADPSGTTCIEVLTRRTSGQASPPASACAP